MSLTRAISLPESEMAEIRLFDPLPENLTYPLVSPKLYAEAEKLLKKPFYRFFRSPLFRHFDFFKKNFFSFLVSKTGVYGVFCKTFDLIDENVVMVGDTMTDILFARNANIRMVGVAKTEKNKQILKKETEIVVHDVSDLLNILE